MNTLYIYLEINVNLSIYYEKDISYKDYNPNAQGVH